MKSFTQIGYADSKAFYKMNFHVIFPVLGHSDVCRGRNLCERLFLNDWREAGSVAVAMQNRVLDTIVEVLTSGSELTVRLPHPSL